MLEECLLFHWNRIISIYVVIYTRSLIVFFCIQHRPNFYANQNTLIAFIYFIIFSFTSICYSIHEEEKKLNNNKNDVGCWRSNTHKIYWNAWIDLSKRCKFILKLFSSLTRSTWMELFKAILIWFRVNHLMRKCLFVYSTVINGESVWYDDESFAFCMLSNRLWMMLVYIMGDSMWFMYWNKSGFTSGNIISFVREEIHIFTFECARIFSWSCQKWENFPTYCDCSIAFISIFTLLWGDRSMPLDIELIRWNFG